MLRSSRHSKGGRPDRKWKALYSGSRHNNDGVDASPLLSPSRTCTDIYVMGSSENLLVLTRRLRSDAPGIPATPIFRRHEAFKSP